MPAAGDQAPEERILRRGRVDVKGLGVELACEVDDLGLGEGVAAHLHGVAHGEIFPVQQLVGHRVSKCSMARAMDEAVLRSMAKWPNVPDVYGWLSLDRRGNWLLKGERIGNAALRDFISRNYLA